MSGRLHRFVEFLYIRPALELIKEHKREFGYAALSLILIYFVAGGNFQLFLITLFDYLLELDSHWILDISFPLSDLLFQALGLVGLWAVFVKLSKLTSVRAAANRAVLILIGFVAARYMIEAISGAGPIFLLNNLLATPVMTVASLALFIMLAVLLRREKPSLSAARYGFWSLVAWWIITGILMLPMVMLIFAAEPAGFQILDTPFFILSYIILSVISMLIYNMLFAAVAIAAQDKAIHDEQQVHQD